MPEFNPYDTCDEIPGRFAVFPLSGVILLPRSNLPLNIFEPRYLAMIDNALRTNRLVGMVQPVDGDMEVRNPEIYSVGGLGRIVSFSETHDGRYIISLRGICRFSVLSELSCDTPFRQIEAEFGRFEDDLNEPPADTPIERQDLLNALRTYMNINHMETDWDSVEQAPAETLVNSLAMICPFDSQEKQALIEAPGLQERAQILTALLQMASSEPAAGSGGQGPVLQ